MQDRRCSLSGSVGHKRAGSCQRKSPNHVLEWMIEEEFGIEVQLLNRTSVWHPQTKHSGGTSIVSNWSILDDFRLIFSLKIFQ